ncbi:MAG: flavodoxin family protein [Candidatus Hermodarchaeota archaeon]
MKVIAINSSPRKNKGLTANILRPFLEGIRESNAELDLFYTKDLTINNCLSCYQCWTKTPGKCGQKDDMAVLLSKFQDADLWIFASPIYCDGITGSMKTIIDRLIPLMRPLTELRNGRCRHLLREEVKSGKIVYVASAAWWKIENFDPMIAYFKAFSNNFNREFAGALLRPHSVALVPLRKEPVFEDITSAAKEAGNQIITQGKISSGYLSTISQELMSQNDYIDILNKGWETKS